MKSQTVAVVDYGSGNLRSVSQAVIHAAQGSGVDVVVTSDASTVMSAGRVVLPGQGHMADCMRELSASGLLDAVLHAAAHKPLFGVCVGMQMLLDHSEEGDTPGLGLIHGEVVRFRLEGRTQPDGSRYKVPQIGWNMIRDLATPLFKDVPENSFCYFVHGYYAAKGEHTIATTDYIQPYSSALHRDNFYGVQFHPEKSAETGEQILKNFIAL